MRPRRLFSLCLTLVFLTTLCQAGNTRQVKVLLQFEYGGGFSKQFSAISVPEESTVLDVMKAMQKHAHRIPFKTRGSGTLSFVYEIDKIPNEGNGKNWMFYVNGKRANVGVGGFRINANDQIVWKFEVFK